MPDQGASRAEPLPRWWLPVPCARIRALQQGTSVNALVRAYLARVAGESEASQGIDEFFTALLAPVQARGPTNAKP